MNNDKELTDYTLSDFANMPVLRIEGRAYIIFDTVPEGDIRLIGFEGDAGKSDFDIQEEGYEYYKQLLQETGKIEDNGVY